MQKLQQGFFDEHGNFISVEHYRKLDQLLIMKDIATGLYFVGKEEDDYNPKYISYKDYGKVLVANKGNNVFDVFTKTGDVVTQDSMMIGSNKIYLIFENSTTQSIISLVSGKFVTAKKCYIKRENFIICELEHENQLYYSSNLTYVCPFDVDLNIEDIVYLSDLKGPSLDRYFIIASNKMTGKYGMFLTWKMEKYNDNLYFYLLGKYKTEEFVNVYKMKIQTLSNALCVPFNFGKIFWDKKLENFIVEENGMKAILKNGNLLKNTTARKIENYNGMCYLCYQSEDIFSVVDFAGDLILPSGKYRICSYYRKEDYYYRKEDYQLLIENLTTEELLNVIWGKDGYSYKQIYNIGRLSWERCYIPLNGYVILNVDGAKNVYYHKKYLGTFKMCCKDGDSKLICYDFSEKKTVFSNGKEVKPPKPPEKREITTVVQTELPKMPCKRNRSEFFANLLMGIDSLPDLKN